jgi:hypothetical protein
MKTSCSDLKTKYREDDWLDARRYREAVGILGIDRGQLITYIDALCTSLEQERMANMKLREKLDEHRTVGTPGASEGEEEGGDQGG